MNLCSNRLMINQKTATEIKMLIDKIVENQRETEQMTFDYFKVVNSLCTPDQQKELQELNS